jgi:AcrR family transcriptional regulator
MPKISAEHRAMRQAQILDAAWRCFHRDGVQATTMEQIIAASGLSASAMYRYFAGKEDIAIAALEHSLSTLLARLEPILDAPGPASVAGVAERLTAEIEAFARRPGYKLTTIALHGWSEAQRNPRLRRRMRTYYGAFRTRLAERVRRWQAEGELAADAAPEDVAQLVLSLVAGFVVQSAILGDASAAAHGRAVAALSRAHGATRDA